MKFNTGSVIKIDTKKKTLKPVDHKAEPKDLQVKQYRLFNKNVGDIPLVVYSKI